MEAWIRAETHYTWIYLFSKNTIPILWKALAQHPRNLFLHFKISHGRGHLNWKPCNPWSLVNPCNWFTSELWTLHHSVEKTAKFPWKPCLNSAKFIKPNKIQRKHYRADELVFSLKLPGRSTRNLLRGLSGICRPPLRVQQSLLQNRKMRWIAHINIEV